MKTLGSFAIIIDNHSRVCCVRLGYAHRGWSTPGGKVELGESPTKALEREVFEETGFVVEVGDLIGVYSKPFADDIVLNFEARILQQEPWVPDSEIVEVSFFRLEELPKPMSGVAKQRIFDGFNGVRGAFREFDKAAASVTV